MKQDAALVCSLFDKGDRTVEDNPCIRIQAREALVSDQGGAVTEFEAPVPVQVPEAQQGSFCIIKANFDDTTLGGRSETDPAAFQQARIAIGRILFLVIDLARRRPWPCPSTFHQRQETEEGLLPVRSQCQRVVGNLVVQQIGTQRCPANELVRHLDRGTRGLQEHPHSPDRRIDLGEYIIRLASCHEQGQGCRPAKELFHSQILRLVMIWVGYK